MTTSRLITATSAAGSKRRTRRGVPAPPSAPAPSAAAFTRSQLCWGSFDELPCERDEGVLEIRRAGDPGGQLAVEGVRAHDRDGGPRAAVLPAARARELVDLGKLSGRSVDLEHLAPGVREHELGGRALRDDAPMRHDGDDIGETLGLLDVVR